MEEELDKSVLIGQLRNLKEEKMQKQEQLKSLDKELLERDNTKEDGEREYDE